MCASEIFFRQIGLQKMWESYISCLEDSALANRKKDFHTNIKNIKTYNVDDLTKTLAMVSL